DRLGAMSISATVRYASSNGTATAGLDYLAVNGVLNFDPFVTNQFFSVPILDDLLIEGNETVNLRLFNATPTNQAGLISPINAVLTIVDNDSSTVIAAGSAFAFESTPNGILDPGERVTL